MFELHIKPCASHDVDIISERLEEQGALSVTVVDQHDDPILEPGPGETPLWPTSIIQALFSDASDAQAAWRAIVSDYPALTHTIHDIPEQDWVRTCLDDVKPQPFGERLWVCPSWHTPPQADAINLMLDPGLAFGTGTHPTTALCLTWLAHADLEAKTVIDYGCGSGILALAALKLGAHHVNAVDLDEQALIATQNNAEKNHLSSEKLSLSQPETLTQPVDILLANILLAPLLALEPRFQTLLNYQGVLVLSGVLATQVEQLIETYMAPEWSHLETKIQGEWALVIFQKT
ncbi:MAG: 50S ribosomal protein L11 methyltransferase [Legionellaceae bacterium]|nr:50S ribosomal protein L11 methyltransferase [Legionellaceae bacterium]